LRGSCFDQVQKRFHVLKVQTAQVTPRFFGPEAKQAALHRLAMFEQ
jgi:hypothetical protein